MVTSKGTMTDHTTFKHLMEVYTAEIDILLMKTNEKFDIQEFAPNVTFEQGNSTQTSKAPDNQQLNSPNTSNTDGNKKFVNSEQQNLEGLSSLIHYILEINGSTN
ncbi:hypothetical protein DPMN_088578 [Dreissena polymorpha]|uniref:Uncharacterized protein n=1 Tax=Dreissena polymorpha TaxID=45954 RepID=A0A9D4KV44_DREPO|nr:hypothetical protein DPMN_088578 [Dreissena polymorpha]